MNADKTHLLEAIDRLPDHLLKQVLNFVEFLLWQQNTTRSPALPPDNAPNAEDQVWLDSDISNLSAHEP